MLWMYLAALGFGGVLIGMSLFGHDADHPGGDHTGDHAFGDAGLFAVFSLRNVTWASFAFGGIGLLAVLTQRSTTTGVVSAGLAGLFTLVGVHVLFRAMQRTEASSEALDALAVGTNATLVLPFNDDGLGMISFRAHGQIHEMPARRANDVATLDSTYFSECTIGWIENGIAVVQPAAR